MRLRALYIDFNSYFASCEQHLRPELRRRPVGIVPMANVETTCCIAASYPAKRFGVKTGTGVAEARRLCPAIQFVQARPNEYIKLHHKLVACVEQCLPVLKILSIDEMVCELPPNWSDRATALRLARSIKERIASEVGPELTSSIGIAPNSFLAKTATEMEKPNGLVTIEAKDLPHCLHTLELRDLNGIGSRMLKRIQRSGIRTVRALCETSSDQLRRIWGGVGGARMYENLRGRWLPHEETQRSSIGHGRILPPEFRNEYAAHALCHRLLQKAATRLRDMDYCARSLVFSIGYSGKQKWGSNVSFFETQDTVSLTQRFEELWARKPDISGVPLKVSLTLCDLIAKDQTTPDMFETTQAAKRRKLDQTMDRINKTLGPSALYYARSHEAMQAVPTRIAFTHIPKVD